MIKIIVRWYDIYIGVYWDTDDKKLYIFLLPMIGIQVDFVAIRRWRFKKKHNHIRNCNNCHYAINGECFHESIGYNKSNCRSHEWNGEGNNSYLAK